MKDLKCLEALIYFYIAQKRSGSNPLLRNDVPFISSQLTLSTTLHFQRQRHVTWIRTLSIIK